MGIKWTSFHADTTIELYKSGGFINCMVLVNKTTEGAVPKGGF